MLAARRVDCEAAGRTCDTKFQGTYRIIKRQSSPVGERVSDVKSAAAEPRCSASNPRRRAGWRFSCLNIQRLCALPADELLDEKQIKRVFTPLCTFSIIQDILHPNLNSVWCFNRNISSPAVHTFPPEVFHQSKYWLIQTHSSD